MTEKKRFLLRLDSVLYAMLEKWAADDLRSVNAQIEYLLTEAGKKSGRVRSEQEVGRRSAGDERHGKGEGTGEKDERLP
jgi:hypothetical protein